MSYRDAYKLMIRFEKYGKPKQLIQQHLQVVPKERNLPMSGVRLTLTGPSTDLNLPLDAAGRAVFPFLKSAYDDNARLVLNQKPGLYALRPQVSITPRADGIYEAAELRAACEQVVAYLQHVGKPSMQNSRCVGVRFAYPRTASDIVVRFRSADQVQTLRVEEGSAFADDAVTVFRTVTYAFADWPEKGQVMAQAAPTAIVAVFE